MNMSSTVGINDVYRPASNSASGSFAICWDIGPASIDVYNATPSSDAAAGASWSASTARCSCRRTSAIASTAGAYASADGSNPGTGRQNSNWL